jgi:hypothetical protein
MTEPLAPVLAALVAGAAAFVALPFLRQPRRTRTDGRRSELPARVPLLERRDRALAALEELEFDHRTGKISAADYQALLGPLRREAIEALRLLESAAPGTRGARAARAPPPRRAR